MPSAYGYGTRSVPATFQEVRFQSPLAIDSKKRKWEQMYLKTVVRTFIVSVVVFTFSSCEAVKAEDGWTRVGAAKVDITPEHPVLLAGYGSRPGEHVDVDQRIWSRALAIGDEDPVVLVAVDNCGVPAHVTAAVVEKLQEEYDAAGGRVVISSTHTHNAPTLTGYAPVVWGERATEDQVGRVDRYTQWLTQKIVQVASESLKNRRDARLAWGQGRVRFGGNRRVLNENKWAGFGFQTDGPVDHSVPVMAACAPDGKPVAIWTNYACHCTTVGSRNHIGGDWAGFCNEQIEKRFSGAVALTTIGCGADIGPQPSGNLDLARQHGTTLAEEVERLIAGDLVDLKGEPAANSREIELPLEEPPTREHFENLAEGQGYHAYHARLMMKHFDQMSRLPTHVVYPVTCWKFDDDLAIVFLAGEVVVDYAVCLKGELDWRRLWINGWSNDVPSYIPSKRLLAEGGYETDFSQIYYAQPSRYAPEVEDLIVTTVKEMVGDEFSHSDDQPDAPFLRFPDGSEWFAQRVGGWIDSLGITEREEFKRLVELAVRSRSGFAELTSEGAEQDAWFNYSGIKQRRPFIRQLEKGATLAWKTTPIESLPDDGNVVLLFLGGVGWTSEPETDGFVLSVNGQRSLQFDVTREVTTWRSTDGELRLDYFPTWTSNVDSGGFFYLDVSRSVLEQGNSLDLAVTSIGTGSKRWFSLDPIKDVKGVEQLLVDALRRIPVKQR